MQKNWAFLFLLFSFNSFAQNKITIPFANGEVLIQQYTASVFKITYTPQHYTTTENPSDAVIASPMAQIQTSLINTSNGIISFTQKQIAALVNAVPKNEYYALQFALDKDEKIFGGGERALPLDRRGYKFNLYNNAWYGYGEGADNINYSVPFFTSSKGYALFFDNVSKGYADIGKTTANIFEVGFVSGELNVFVVLGSNYAEILKNYYAITGTQPLPPIWALGNLMSRFGYTSELQAKEIVAKMQAENVPIDAIIFDLFWFGDSIKQTLGNLDWVNKTAWPNPKKMIADFKKSNINNILITEPFVVKTSTNYTNSLPFNAVDSMGKPYVLTDFYFGLGGLIDIFRKDAQQWFWSKYTKQMNIGVEGWWGDLGEPEKHPNNLYHNLNDFGFKRLFGANEVHNLYGHIWTKMLYTNYAKHYPTKRLFSLNRSGFAGSQRYSIFPWTGDVSRSWTGYRAQLPILLGMSMSGIPYVHSDAGGFAGGEGDNELYIRWLQMAAFTPIFKPHGTALYEVDKQAFSFPSEPALIDTPYRDMAKWIVKLRYAFLPYNYNLAYQQTKHGRPLMAPLYFYFANDTVAAKVEDEYMWGENILVAPILHKGSISRKVYLPEGEWYKLKKEKVIGKRWIDMPCKLYQNDIYFIKAGAFVAIVENPINNTASFKKNLVTFYYYPTANSSSYEYFYDDGLDKTSIQKNKFGLLKLSSTGLINNACTLNITPLNTGINLLQTIVLKLPFCSKPTSVVINNKQLLKSNGKQLNNFFWNDFSKELVLEVQYTNKPINIKLSF